MSSADILKEAGNIWNTLSQEEKQHYVDLSEIDRARYSREMEEWHQQKCFLYRCFISSPGVCLKQRREKEPKTKDLSLHSFSDSRQVRIPKKVRSAYIFFCLKHRSRIQEENESSYRAVFSFHRPQPNRCESALGPRVEQPDSRGEEGNACSSSCL